MAESSAEVLKFHGIGLVGKAGGGFFKITANQFGWKCTDVGSDASVQYTGSDLQSAEWQQACGRKYVLKLCFKDGGGVSKFVGFEQKDLASLKAHLAKHFSVQLSEVAVTTDGWSWGDLSIDGENEVKLTVGGKLAFEVQLSDLDQVTSVGKQDVNFTMQPSKLGPTDEMLHEIRLQVAPDWLSAEGLREELQRKGGLSEKGEALGRISDVMLVAPRGKHDLEFFRQSMKVRGKTQTYTVKYSSIARLFLLTMPGKRDVSVVVGLDHPMRSGQQQNYFLVFDMQKDSMMIPDLQKDKMETYRFAPGEKKAVHEILAYLLKDLSGNAMVCPPSDFKSRNECHCLRASHKAQPGHLFPMKKSLLFVNKPVIWLRYDQIEKISFVRGMSRARSFDINVFVKGKPHVEFGQLETDDGDELVRYLSTVGVNLENADMFSNQSRKSTAASSTGAPPERKYAAAASKQRKAAPEPAPADDEDDEDDDEDFASDQDSTSPEGDLSDDDDSADEQPKKRTKRK